MLYTLTDVVETPSRKLTLDKELQLEVRRSKQKVFQLSDMALIHSSDHFLFILTQSSLGA